MPNDTYSIDGTPLDDPAGRWRLTSKTELPQWGAMVSPSVKVPHRNGVLPIAPIASGVSTVKLELLIAAAGQTAGLRTLRSITGARSLHTMGWTRRDGESLEAVVRVSSSVSIKPQGIDGDLLATFTVEAVDGEWRRTRPEKVVVGTNQRKSFPIITGKDALATVIAIKADTDGGTVVVRDTLGPAQLSVGRVPSGSWLAVDTEAWEVRSISAGKEQTAGEDYLAGLPMATRSIPSLSLTPGGFRLAQRENGDGVVEVNGGSAILWWKGVY